MIALLGGAHVPAAAVGAAPNALVDTLAEPITVWLTDGRVFTGTPRSVTDRSIILAVEAGRVEYTLGAGEILRVELPGARHIDLARDLMGEGRRAEALVILETLYYHRLPYLPYLREKEVLAFAALVDGRLQQGRSVEAVAVAKHLLPHLPEQSRDPLEAALLLGYFRLGWDEAARTQAEAWIRSAGPYRRSALGWWIIAATALQNQDYETALDHALHPIVFSSQLPVDDLELCYAIAVHAALALNDSNHARLLFGEMRDRRLKWPSAEFPLPDAVHAFGDQDNRKDTKDHP